MATVVSQHIRHFDRHLGFFKINLISAKLKQIFLKLVKNMCLPPQVGVSVSFFSRFLGEGCRKN